LLLITEGSSIIETYIDGQWEGHSMRNIANKWINDTLIRDVTIPSIPGPEDFNN
jgi:hypothetical protein